MSSKAPEAGNVRYFNDVEMKVGVKVFCCDRDTPYYDCEGVIHSRAPPKSSGDFMVAFEKSDGKYSAPVPLRAEQIWPTSEEQKSDQAVQRRANNGLNVFLCHASENKQAARGLRDKLLTWGIQPWLDEVNIPLGSDWDIAIKSALRRCHVVLVLLSQQSVAKSGYVQQEIQFALDQVAKMKKPPEYIIPVLLDGCPIPLQLKRWQSIVVNEPAGLERLLSDLNGLAKELWSST